MSYRKLWIAFSLVVGLSFGVLGYYGWQIYMQAPPVPDRVVTAGGRTLFTGQEIRDGQNVWQSLGGQELGSIWGHGGYVAPDWSADWLHREAVWILDEWSQSAHGRNFEELSDEDQASLRARLRDELRTNTYDPGTGDLVISPVRARATEALASYYASLFGNDPEFAALRDAYAIPENALRDPERQRLLAGFYFWTAWACTTNRPGSNVTYTHNWPAEELVGNRPTGDIIVWSVISFVLLLGGIGALAWYFAVKRHSAESEVGEIPATDPLLALRPTPSMKATLKYFWVVAALLVAQVGLGAVTAHYGVEGAGFYGIPLADWLPYAVTRTWHTQLGIFWIATAWLATGLFMAPAVSGHEPQFQRAGVNFLFVALLVIVVGSLAGQWMGIQQRLGLEMNFWFGHQGYEYVDLGRFWQAFLLVGLFLWLFLMGRALWPALRKKDPSRHLLIMFFIASAAIALFYAAGLMWGRQTNLAMAEYWRWWVVHLWVEGFFEVFATVVIAFLFTRMGLLKAATATAAVLFSTVIFLSGGIIGTFHHLYFAGTPTGSAGPRRDLQRPGGGATGVYRIRSLREPDAEPVAALGIRLQVAHLLLRVGRLLESGGRGPVRFSHQPAYRPLLYAGPEYDAGARPYRPLRSVRNAGHRADAVLSQGTRHAPRLEGPVDLVRVLVDQRRPGADGAPEPVTGRPTANLGERRSRDVVRAFGGIPADTVDGNAAMASRAGGHDIRRGGAGARMVRAGVEGRLVSDGRDGAVLGASAGRPGDRRREIKQPIRASVG